MIAAPAKSGMSLGKAQLIRDSIGIFSVGLLARLVVFLHFNGVDMASDAPIRMSNDAPSYDVIAANIAFHGVFSQSEGVPFVHEVGRTPGYPLFLSVVYAIAGHLPALAILAQIALASFTAGIAYLIATEAGCRRSFALLIGMLLALEPLAVSFDNLMITESLFTLLLMVMMYCVMRWYGTGSWLWLVAVGGTIGLMALTRPVAEFLPIAILPVLIAVALMRRPKATWRELILVSFTVLILGGAPVVAWSYVNFEQRGVFTLSTVGTHNLLFYRAAAVYARQEDASFEDARTDLREVVDEETAERDLTFSEQERFKQQLAIEILADHPFWTISQTLVGAKNLFLTTGAWQICRSYGITFPREDCSQGSILDAAMSGGVVLWELVLMAVAYIGGAIGSVVLWRRNERALLVVFLAVVGYFVAVSSGAESYYRLRLPFFPLIMILSGFGWAAVAEYRRYLPVFAPLPDMRNEGHNGE